MLHAATRSRFVEGRTLLRLSLGLMIGMDPLALPLVISPQGKPHLSIASPMLRFSLAAGEFNVCVAARIDGEVGVDIEEIAPPDFEAVAMVIMSPSEIADFRSMPSSVREKAFLRSWTRKEAVLKAAGTGLLNRSTNGRCRNIRFSGDRCCGRGSTTGNQLGSTARKSPRLLQQLATPSYGIHQALMHRSLPGEMLERLASTPMLNTVRHELLRP